MGFHKNTISKQSFIIAIAVAIAIAANILCAENLVSQNKARKSP